MREPQCLFAPHETPQRHPSASYIPPHAWRHISSLLASHTPLTSTESKVQTLRISDLVNDASLEGIGLGLVYTVPEAGAAGKELRSLDGSGNGEVWGREMGREEGDRRCLAQAVSQVEKERLMEGVLQVQGRWRVGFLVYMLD
jgi:hypothetical protein